MPVPGLGRAGQGLDRKGYDMKSKKLGFTNKLCVALTVLLFMGMCMGFVLAVLSIESQYIGALECFTVVFTPIGIGINIVFVRSVKKSEMENTGADGEGVNYWKSVNGGCDV